MSKTVFRTDINGLRAIAVVSVVLFHFGVSGFSGGFVGVDIFFVISGFLMTGIIVKGIDKSTFNFRNFYLARARRIVPALFFLTIALLFFGWVYLSPDDYVGLGREVDKALLFLSNSYYFKKSGYFDPDSHERLLLHTWSLSVEWQFYILYPIILFLVSRVSKKIIPSFIVTLFLVSFAHSVYKSHIDSSYAFYMLPSRAWEMLLGGIAYYSISQKRYNFNRNWCHYLGVLFIVLAVFIYSPVTVWPGFAALLPTLGTALIIYASKDSLFTSNPIFQKLGDWSYSIYLWHWPLVVFIVLFDIDKTVIFIIGLILLSVILGALSYYVIENPTRNYFYSKRRVFVFLIILIPVVAVLGAAKNIRDNKGFINRISEDVFFMFNQANHKFHEMYKCHDKRDAQDCIYGTGELGVIVTGDSHAMSLLGSVTKSLEGHQVLDWTDGGCPTILGVKSKDKNTSRCNDFLSSRFDRLPDYTGVPILVANRFSYHLLGGNEKSSGISSPKLYITKPYGAFSEAYINEMYSGYVEALCTLAKNNPVYLLKPTPELKLNVPNIMGRSLLASGKEQRVSVSMAEYKERNQVALHLLDEVANKCNITLLDPIPYLCDGERCYGDIDGLPIFFDDDHLNMRGSDLLKPLFEKALLNK